MENLMKKIKSEILFLSILILLSPASLVADQLASYNNKSPFPDVIFSEIQKQIENRNSKKEETGNEDDAEEKDGDRQKLLKILHDTGETLRKDFKSIVYKMENDLSIALAFFDVNVGKYFKPTKKGVFVDFKRDRLELYVKTTNGNYKSQNVIFPYQKRKIKTGFLQVDDAGGFFFFVPDFGEEEVQSVVMCPRILQRSKGENTSKVLANNNWQLSDVLGRTYSKASIVVNEIDNVKISALTDYSNDCHLDRVYDEKIGKLTSVKAEYEPIQIDRYERFTTKPFKFPLVFSLLSQVSYEKDKTKKIAQKRIVYEVRDFYLKDEFKFKNSTLVAKGPCYAIVMGNYGLKQIEN